MNAGFFFGIYPEFHVFVECLYLGGGFNLFVQTTSQTRNLPVSTGAVNIEKKEENITNLSQTLHGTGISTPHLVNLYGKCR